MLFTLLVLFSSIFRSPQFFSNAGGTEPTLLVFNEKEVIYLAHRHNMVPPVGI